MPIITHRCMLSVDCFIRHAEARAGGGGANALPDATGLAPTSTTAMRNVRGLTNVDGPTTDDTESEARARMAESVQLDTGGWNHDPRDEW
jgi:hypothetical protein